MNVSKGAKWFFKKKKEGIYKVDACSCCSTQRRAKKENGVRNQVLGISSFVDTGFFSEKEKKNKEGNHPDRHHGCRYRHQQLFRFPKRRSRRSHPPTSGPYVV